MKGHWCVSLVSLTVARRPIPVLCEVAIIADLGTCLQIFIARRLAQYLSFFHGIVVPCMQPQSRPLFLDLNSPCTPRRYPVQDLRR